MPKLIQIMNNFHRCEINGIIVWFSYETPIAFERVDGTVVVSENVWTRTAGKHINYIKNNRECEQINHDDFTFELVVFAQ